MDTKDLEKELHVSRFIIFYKFILGVFELLLGLGIIFFGTRVYALYQGFVAQQLFEDPHDLLGTVLESIVPYLFEHKGYVILILVILGLVKMVGAAALWYRRHWGLDLLIGLTLSLLPFEGYNLLVQPSLIKLAFFLINILISLYLVNFAPKQYFYNLKHRIKRTK